MALIIFYWLYFEFVVQCKDKFLIIPKNNQFFIKNGIIFLLLLKASQVHIYLVQMEPTSKAVNGRSCPARLVFISWSLEFVSVNLSIIFFILYWFFKLQPLNKSIGNTYVNQEFKHFKSQDDLITGWSN